MSPIFYASIIFVFIAVVMAFEGAWEFWNSRHGPAARRLQSRINSVAAATGAQRESLSILKAGADDSSSRLRREFAKLAIVRALARQLQQAGLSWSVGQLLTFSALLPLGDEQEQIEFAKKIKQNGLSVRATESGVADRIQALDGGELRIVDSEGNSRPVPRPRNEQLESLQQELRTALGTKVDLAQSAKGKGKLTIHFSSHEEFERIRQLLTATQAAAQAAPPQQQMFA